MQAGAVLTRAADLVEQGWCQDGIARDVHGQRVPWDSPVAVAWCAQGAMHRALRDAGAGPAVEVAVVEALVRVYGEDWCQHMREYNDAPGRQAGEVAQRFRDAGSQR